MKYSGTLFNLIFSLALLITGTSVQATLFISEYVEGSSNNKAIELYNGGSADINLLAVDYSLRIFFNGSSSANGIIALTGSIDPTMFMCWGTRRFLQHLDHQPIK